MRLLFVMHAFLRFVEGKDDVSAAALRAILDAANLLFLSPADQGENCVKLAIGTLVLAEGWPRQQSAHAICNFLRREVEE